MKHALVALLFGASLFGSLALAPRPAAAQSQIESREAIALNNQIAELHHDIEMLREQVGRGGGGSSSLGGSSRSAPSNSAGSDLTAQLLDRVNQLEDEVRTLRGRLDESDNARTRMGEDLNKQMGDLKFKLDGGAAAGAAGGAATGAPAGGAPAGSLDSGALGGAGAAPAAGGKRTPAQALQDGNAALARRDYPAAEVAAREVLASPRSPRTVDASFLLAQSYYGRRDWAHAAVAYDDTYRAAPSGAHAQDAELGLAASLIGMGDKRTACEALDRLRTPRPDLRDAVVAQRQRAGCR